VSHILHSHTTSQEVAEPDKEPVTLDVFRYNPEAGEEGSFQRFILAYRRRMSVFTALREIYELHDPTLAFRRQQCGRGICGTCRLKVDIDRLGFDNKSIKSCAVTLEPGDHVTIRPARDHGIIRDLVVAF